MTGTSGGNLDVFGDPGTDGDYTTLAYSAATGARLWAATYSGKGYDDAKDVVVSADGSRVFVTGGSRATGTGFDHDNSWYDGVEWDALTIAYDAATGDLHDRVW